MWIEFPSILDGEKPKIQAYTLVSAIAEKYQAMIDLDMLNSRMKDFYDIYFLCQNLPFEGALLQKAIEQTFQRRKTAIPSVLPTVFTATFYENKNTLIQWRAFRRKLKLEYIPSDLNPIIDQIQAFLWPATENITQGKILLDKWQPKTGWR